ncbi:alanine racemase [Hazenella coriacea]|uniref:Alanine racemase n=1 Tax=Hazenella coriacea TaxID=1179467 RepID=A0A4R3L153_9BACL|nr:alanine racemase [Hazenella coriacea]TCS93271.1 alanine racemase [Hazenella coriacea]
MEKNQSKGYGRDTVIEIDLDAVAHNVKQFIQHLPKGKRIMAVVKADAYGHGAIPVAREALEAGATYLGVALVDEGIELRRAGIEAPILVLGYTPTHAIADAIHHHLHLTVFSNDVLNEIEATAARLQKKAMIHVKVDTGMGRIGLQPKDAISFITTALKSPHVIVEGLFTHFATADEVDKNYTYYQEEQFAVVTRGLEKLGIKIPVVHSTNSAAAIDLPDHVYDMIRLGISLYGYYPSKDVDHRKVQLKPALTFKTKIVHLKQLPAGWGVSYGKTYKAHGDEWIATLPVGYADGLSRQRSNRGHALVNGVKVPMIGRVCMDQVMLDVSKAMPVKIGDEVVLYGKQGNNQITVDEVAEELNTINYEITSLLSHRIPRIYYKKGQAVEIYNRLRLT